MLGAFTWFYLAKCIESVQGTSGKQKTTTKETNFSIIKNTVKLCTVCAKKMPPVKLWRIVI